MGGAVKINHGQSDCVINWAGGLHHAKKGEVCDSPPVQLPSFIEVKSPWRSRACLLPFSSYFIPFITIILASSPGF